MSINSRKFIVEFNNKLENAKNPFLDEADDVVIDESTSLSRLLTKMTPDQSFVAISAEHHDGKLEKKMTSSKQKNVKHNAIINYNNQQQINNQNTKDLESYLKKNNLNYVKTYGVWADNGKFKTFENSFLVNGVTKEQALNLGRIYNQEAVIYKPSGEMTAYLICTITEDDGTISEYFGDIWARFDLSSSKFKQITQPINNVKRNSGYSNLKGKSALQKDAGQNYAFAPTFSNYKIGALKRSHKKMMNKMKEDTN